MKQLHVVCDISVRSGGLGLAALRYSQALGKAGASVTLFVAKRTADEIEFTRGNEQFYVVGPTVRLGANKLIAFWRLVLALRKCLNQGEYDIVHLHGTWSPILAIAARMARLKRIPYVVSPHGCLEPWALEHRRTKKWVALALYQRDVLEKASMLVATANQELKSIRSLGLAVPVAVLPNGVDLSVRPENVASDFRKILFLSRVHPKKGLADLVMAWTRVKKDGWKITIAGPSELGYEEEIRGLVRRLGIEMDFDFLGLVTGEKKERCFAEADVFILPTYSENFGIAVAEALGRGLPVITTTGAPWHELETYRCGWWVAPGIDGISEGLSAAMALPRYVLAEMGARGRRLIEDRYTWERIGFEALRASEWMLRRTGAPPDCVDE